MAYILIIIIVLVAIWPVLRPYVARWMQHRTEDTIRRMMGMPSRKEEKKARRRAEKEAQSNQASRRQYKSPHPQGPIIPKEYAEDVEYTEYKEYTRKETVINADKTSFHESQVEDVEYKEVRKQTKG